MVHALCETWRVLAPRGTLLDLRPLSAACPIDVLTVEDEIKVGEVDATGYSVDDAAADRAVRNVVDDGWFVPYEETRFDFEFYWNTVAEMKSFIEQSERMSRVCPSYADLERSLTDLSAAHGGKARLRCRRPTMLAVYGKAAELGAG